MNRRKRRLEFKEDLQIKNVMIRYFNVDGWPQNKIVDAYKILENDFYMRGLYNLYSHIEVVPSDRDEIVIKQIYVRKRK